MPEYPFTSDDTITLATFVHENDVDATTAWLELHVRTTRDMHALMEFLLRAIHKIFPMAITKDVKLTRGEFWALDVRGARRSDAEAARMMTAAFNGDWATASALIKATLAQHEDFHAEVLVRLLKALGDGMRAVTAEAGRQK